MKLQKQNIKLQKKNILARDACMSACAKKMVVSATAKSAQPAPPDTTWEELARQQDADGFDEDRLRLAGDGRHFALLDREDCGSTMWRRIFVTKVGASNNWLLRHEDLSVCDEPPEVVKGYTKNDLDLDHGLLGQYGMYYVKPFKVAPLTPPPPSPPPPPPLTPPSPPPLTPPPSPPPPPPPPRSPPLSCPPPPPPRQPRLPCPRPPPPRPRSVTRPLRPPPRPPPPRLPCSPPPARP